MYTEYIEFRKPDGNPKLWRFMDFTKFIHILDSNALYFARSDLLGDPFEGTWTELTIKEQIDMFDKLLPGSEFSQLRTDSHKNDNLLHQIWNLSNFISCWHMNEDEPYDMWKTYTKTNEAVSIQSSWSRFVDSFNETIEEVHVGQLTYLNYKREKNSGNNFKQLLTKRKNFAHENELRAIVTGEISEDVISNAIDSQRNIINLDAFQQGLNIKVNLERLIEKIVIAPNAPSWFKSLVESVCKKYNIKKSVEYSEIDEKPISY